MITKKYYKLIRISREDSEYMRLKNISNEAGIFKMVKTGSPTAPNLEYSLDGVNWTTYDFTTLPEVTVAAGANIYFRGNNTTGFNRNANNRYSFDMNTDYSVGGNIATIINGNSPETVTALGYSCLNGLFYSSTHIIDAKDMTFGNITTILGTTTDLWNGAIASMFYNCVNLKTPPDCSSFQDVRGAIAMFRGCTSLQYGIDLSNVIYVLDHACSISQLYYGCSNIYSATAPNISNINTTILNAWLDGAGTQATGTKVVNVPTGATIATDSTSGIPTGWTRVDY